MADAPVVVLAVAVSLGAWAVPASGGPPWVPTVLAGVVIAAAGHRGRRWTPVWCGAALVAAGLAARGWQDAVPVPVGRVEAPVTLVGDPARAGERVRAVVRLDDRRLEAWAVGVAGRKLEQLAAGEVAVVRGSTGPLASRAAARLAPEHVVGTLEVDVVIDTGSGGPLARAANRLRRSVADGVAGLPVLERTLFLGLVLGDDRGQPPEVVDDFRASGLSHLTAVSGQNVAFVLGAAGPLLRRLGRRGRVVAVLALLGMFATMTRFEPSVLRATAMAALVTVTVLADRPQPTLRVLGLAVVACTLVDPFLVHRVGWWLSVAATCGIAVLARPLAARLAGPRPLREVLAVTVAAQVGVAPVQAMVFDGLAVVAVPVNLLAAPAAAPVMGYGVPVALLAGVLPEGLAGLLHLPNRLCMRWLLLLARLGAAAPLGTVAGPAVVAAVAGLAAAALGRRRLLRRLGWGLVAVAVAVSAGRGLAAG